MKKKTPAHKHHAVERSGKRPAASKISAPRAVARKQREEEEAPQDLDTILKGVTASDETKRVSHWTQVQCPYCGENFDVHFDSVEDGHSVQEDCSVCCKPIALSVSIEDDDVHVSAYRA